MTEFEIPEPPITINQVSLRQAVEWIALGLKPLPEEYEIVIRKTEEIQNSTKKQIDHAKRILVLALMEERLFAKGEMISGDRFHEFRKPCWHSLNRYDWDFNQIRWDKNEIFCPKRENSTYANISLEFNDLVKIFPKFSDLEIVRKSISDSKENSKPSSATHHRPHYLSPYMQLLDLAVTEFKITPTNQPSTKILTDWFFEQLKKMKGERYHSIGKAKMLATFVREPESQMGGLKKLKKNVISK